MRFLNARQCVHDAYATNQTTPDRMEAGGTKFNSNNAVCHQAEAGKIIKAVSSQKAYLAATCIFLHAPDGWATEKDVALMKSRIWAAFVKSSGAQMDLGLQGDMLAIFDRVLLNYRRSLSNSSSGDLYTGAHIATILGRSPESYHAKIRPLQNLLHDVLERLDFISLQPVWEIVNAERAKVQIQREAEQCAG